MPYVYPLCWVYIPVAGLLDHMASIFLVFKEISAMIFTDAALITLIATVHKCNPFSFFYILASISYSVSFALESFQQGRGDDLVVICIWTRTC